MIGAHTLENPASPPEISAAFQQSPETHGSRKKLCPLFRERAKPHSFFIREQGIALGLGRQ